MSDTTMKNKIANTFLEMADMLENGSLARNTPIVVTAIGSEHGEEVIYQAARQAARKGIFVKLIGSIAIEQKNIEWVPAQSEEEAHQKMEQLLQEHGASAAVTMHYPFPIGVSTVGRIVTPATGKAMYLATTTGTSAVHRVEAMVKNAIYGIITAKASGIARPTVGILNVDGARQTEIALKKLKENGYDVDFACSHRADGGMIMRGNDLLSGAADVMVMDSLTGNVLMKVFSAYTTGGGYETVGYGYGPGVGESFEKLVLIISRASGTPLVAGAVEFAKELVDGNYQTVLKNEFEKAKAAGLSEILAGLKQEKSSEVAKEVKAPPKEVVTEEILGIEIMELEEAVTCLWQEGIYAESGMGCTGPMVLVSEANYSKAKALLQQKGYVGA